MKFYELTATMENTLDNEDTYPASNLVDGDYNTIAHTRATNSGIWLRVQLESIGHINLIKIHNRKDCCKDRIIGLSVFIKRGDLREIEKCTTITEEKDVYEIECTGQGRIVEISKEGDVDDQNIAEIEVFGRGSSYF